MSHQLVAISGIYMCLTILEWIRIRLEKLSMSALVNEILVCNHNISWKITSKHVFPPPSIHILTVG